MKVTDQNYYIDGYLKSNLDLAKEVVTKDWDMIFLIDGYEGSGKSVITQQIAYYLDPTFNLDRIAFNPTDFKSQVLKAQKYQAIIYDEAYGGLNSKGSLDAVNKSLTQMLTVIRSRNLFVFIVLPSFFDINKYVALWRARALVHVYTGDNFERGYFKFYNQERKKIMYVEGKKYYSYSKGRPNFIGRFTNHYTVNPTEYKEKKLKTSLMDSASENDMIKQLKTLIAHNIQKASLRLNKEQIAGVLEVTRMTLYRYLKHMEENPAQYPQTLVIEGSSLVTNSNINLK